MSKKKIKKEIKKEDKMLEISKKYLQGVCECVGEDFNREGLLDTPRRIARSVEFLLSGYNKEDEVKKLLSRQFSDETYNQIIVIDNIDFSSACEHHFLTFFGKVHVGYIPSNKKVVGLSKIPRVVEIYSRRLQQQERLTHQICEAIDKYVQPQGVIVYVEGIHMCCRARGAQTPNAVMKTAAVRGKFLTDSDLEQKFYQMIQLNNLR
jgi:GTP cyclohydrolase I